MNSIFALVLAALFSSSAFAGLKGGTYNGTITAGDRAGQPCSITVIVKEQDQAEDKFIATSSLTGGTTYTLSQFEDLVYVDENVASNVSLIVKANTRGSVKSFSTAEFDDDGRLRATDLVCKVSKAMAK